MRRFVIVCALLALSLPALGGKGEWNSSITTHSQDGGWIDHYVTLHYENISVDSQSPRLNSRSDYDDLKTASAVSQVAFDVAVDEVGGSFETWYEGFAAAAQAVVRESYSLQ